ncbi:unnamed protein product [Arctia plantaginis]|uniref:Secreted protein n=1 Tax=Arctia plantaginis TaxID=874455 RepID=A0A8S1AW61_ARCPL|nr:unnamed protein product [Arctia plantaginis]
MIALVLCFVCKIIQVAKSSFCNCEVEQFESRKKKPRKCVKKTRNQRRRKVAAHAYVSYGRCACAFDALHGGVVVVIRLTTVFTCVCHVQKQCEKWLLIIFS